MNYRTPENVATLQEMIKTYNALVDEFATVQIVSGKQLKLFQKVCNDFLNRTRINTDALIPLLENYKTKTSAILPIGFDAIIRTPECLLVDTHYKICDWVNIFTGKYDCKSLVSRCNKTTKILRFKCQSIESRPFE